jgi:streptogramin lyase
MTKFKKSLFSFLLIFVFIACCEGQSASTQSQKDQISTSSKEKHPTMIRTQGSKFGVVSCELLDKSGNLWFSVSGEGAYLFDGISFTNYTAKDGLCSNHVSAIIQDRLGNILLGTNCGIAVYDGKTFKKYPIPDTLNITCMLEDKEGNLWFGTKGNGIYCYNGATLQNFLNGQSFNLGSTNQLILDMIQDRNGNLWFSSWNGGGVWRYDGKEFTNFLPAADYYKTNQDNRNIAYSQHAFKYISTEDHISDDMIYSMKEDNLGNIWFATRNHGICRYDGKKFKSIGSSQGFHSDGATAILQDPKNNFWITTWDKGVWYYDGKTFTNFKESKGLVNNAVMSVMKDNNGNVWFGTKWFGLSRYDGKTFKTFSQSNH